MPARPVDIRRRRNCPESKKQLYRTVLASVKQEMAEPRAVESAQTEASKPRNTTVKEADKT
jgi:hypothetical protein